ncbi:LacI family DNA-binding transcriptional regulator [Carboxydochorda subterranea]|uniref:LacI family DNA-binding transcriptional regulator n=1 Tax=Carboxydichorda subterranea TaxID=3109565 RepID=A0ABZ1BXA2_9FIRM|nr:LacI family DNA-binding transcriptional regulator [Limnochorda sp. L945t]WRP16723.1 LacI family DNA-binding transcriptional regulator [Limnochorda sp. L945t]
MPRRKRSETGASSGRVTLDEVAQLAGVSKATVSRVINGKSCVRPHVRERVIKAVKKMNYHPNAVARALATRRTGQVGLLLALPSSMPGYGLGLIQGIEAVLRREQMHLVLNVMDAQAAQWDPPSTVTQRQVDGLIVGGDLNGASWLKELAGDSLPVVVLGDEVPEGVQFSAVTIDWLTPSAQATERLLAAGHRRIGAIVPGGRWGDQVRAGFERALAGAGVAADSSRVARVDVSELRNGTAHAAGYRAARQVLGLAERAGRWTPGEGLPVTALYVAHEALVPGVLHALKESSISVPQDLALVVWGHGSAGEQAMGLTAVTVNREQMGRMAALMLLDLLKDRGRQAVQLAITPSLVVRESCGTQRAEPSRVYSLA